MISRTLTEDERKAGRLPEDWQYDLPSEEQWEYATRAGTSTRFYFGDDLNQLPQHGNFADKIFYDTKDTFSNHAHRTLDDGFAKLAPVGSFKPNPWGLHDVYGNIYEWCRDNGARGGSWITIPENCRSAYRDHYSSRDNQIYLGYRIVIQPNVPDPKSKK
jgi:formylglycine-generating enzyme required for sulfatase activity